jgi:cell wall-associated NlpC family hydrolase
MAISRVRSGAGATGARVRNRLFGVLAVGSLLAGLAVASPALADDYPTWDEVEQARQNEASAAAAVSNIEELLAGLEMQSAELARQAQTQAEAYNAARNELDVAAARADTLDQQAKDAEQRATDSARRAGQLIAQLARTGGGSVSLALLTSPDASDLLATLGTMGKVTEQSSRIYQQAIADRNAAASLTEQARVAETERTKLSKAAEDAAAAAEAASAAARQELAAQYAAADQLYAQLASLKGTTAETERQYLAGIANPGTPSNPSNPDPGPGPGPGTPPPTDPDPGSPPPTSGAAQGAINFAYAQVGDPYVYGGAGPNGWDCSGLTMKAYQSVGVYIGIHGASSQYNYLASQGRLVSVNSLIPGDLVFYSTGGSTSGMKYHTAIYIGGGLMIEAPYEPLSVQVTPLRYRDLVPYAARPAG